MNWNHFVLGATAVFLGACSGAETASHAGFAAGESRESYGLGNLVGEQLRTSITDVDAEAFAAGFVDGFGDRSLLTPEQLAVVLAERREREVAAAREEARAIAERNEVEGRAFREEFASGAEVVSLDSGLLYRVLQQGDGPIPEASDVVGIHFRGSFVDGTEFDSSYGEEEPFRVQVDRVIPGWTEALQLMPVGSRWQIVVPPELAYGAQGAGERIEPGATLIFEMELVAVG